VTWLTPWLLPEPCRSALSDARARHVRRAQGANLMLPVALLHVAAFSMGYFLCKGLGFNEKTSRTVSIETGALITCCRSPMPARCRRGSALKLSRPAWQGQGKVLHMH